MLPIDRFTLHVFVTCDAGLALLRRGRSGLGDHYLVSSFEIRGDVPFLDREYYGS